MGSIAFYVSAHQDDWQLFRGRQARLDVEDTSNRIVFIYLTAGNINNPDGSNFEGWWESREAGAVASCKELTGASFALQGAVTVNGRSIVKAACGNTASYFLRIDDNAFTSLRQDGSAQAMDGSTVYSGWQDLVDTLKEVLDAERIAFGQNEPWVNTSEFDAEIDPDNNPSHVATGQAVMDATAGLYKRALWRSYSITSLDVNMSQSEVADERRLFFAYNTATTEAMDARGAHYDDYEANPGPYDSWFGKEYARSLGP